MRSAILFVFCLFSACIVAQADRWLEFRYAPGAFLPHRVSIPQLRTGPSSSFQLSYVTGVDGSADWHHFFKGPRRGIGFMALDMGNPEELGDFYCLYPFMELPLVQSDRSMLYLHMGVGMSYVTEPYDFETNFFNKAIGSHVNYGIVMAARYERIWNRFKLGTGISMSHASNAAIQLPNLGVNFASWDFCAAYLIHQGEQVEWSTDREWTQKKNVDVMLGLGLRESNAFTREKHAVQEFRVCFQKRFSPKMDYRVGTDLIHNKASYQDLDDGQVEEFGADALQWGVHGGIGLLFGRSIIYFQNGFYLLQGHQDQGFIYHRFGGNWRFSEKCSFDLSLKTHFAKADYLSLGFGYSIASSSN